MYVGKNLFDKFNSSLQELILNNINANPSDFLNFSIFFEHIKSLEVSQTKFRIEAHTFADMAISLKILRLRQIADFNLSFLPMYKLKNLRIIKMQNN